MVAYLVTDRDTDARTLFAPVFSDVGPDLLAAARDADLAFFDGSFWSDDELAEAGVLKSARALGHAPVGGPEGSLARLAFLDPGSGYFAHINNTNPILDPSSSAAQTVARAGFAVTRDSLEFHV